MNKGIVPGSFRDPSGFLFFKEGVLYRQVNNRYRKDFEMLVQSGLYDRLVESGLLVPHQSVDLSLKSTEDAYTIIRPKKIPFISYPYEWSFSQLKDAALLTLEILKLSLEFGMLLKDASNYNVQFMKGRPIFIDTLSFESYQENQPWIAYRQFCEHFLTPLALMQHVDPLMNKLLRTNIDGIPLELTAKILPFRARLNLRFFPHIFLHARSKKHYADRNTKPKKIKFTKLALKGFIDGLQTTVQSIKWKSQNTEWGDYYSDTNYTQQAHENKKEIVTSFLEMSAPNIVWDLGANDGTFSRIASELGKETVSFDYDPVAIEKSYRFVKKNKEEKILPLLLDLNNPSPDIGWDNSERESLRSRGPCDTLMALALVHHLAISNNVPLDRVAKFFAGLCRWLIIEWVPKEDSQVKRLLSTREDIFPSYTQDGFEIAFEKYFKTLASKKVNNSLRILYLFKTRPSTSM